MMGLEENILCKYQVYNAVQYISKVYEELLKIGNG